MRDDQPIKLSSGKVLPSTIADYDSTRSKQVLERMENSGVHPFCHAPFVNLDFSPTGTVTPCNHWHSECLEVDEDFSILEAWRGERLRNIRQMMLEYNLDRDSCKHCVRQTELGLYDQVFAQCQFDRYPTENANPDYPKRMIFRMTNVCNLACIMCDADTSSRVRSEFEKLPPLKPLYGERFFEELRQVLPHLEHVEFYGGEPFLVNEHLRIFDLITETNSKCSIYVNTNGTILTERVKKYLETLNFTTIAISMDAVNPELHFQIRKGLKGDLFARNLDWYLQLAKRRNIHILLNVTEHRKNWFEIPEIFRLAERHHLFIHINTCIHPVHVTLYSLPSVQLAYVLDFAERQRQLLINEFDPFANLKSYDYFVSLIRNELSQRTNNWTPPLQPSTSLSDGLLGAPIPGKGVCSTPEQFLEEIRHLSLLDPHTAMRFVDFWQSEIETLKTNEDWPAVAVVLAKQKQLLLTHMATIG